MRRKLLTLLVAGLISASLYPIVTYAQHSHAYSHNYDGDYQVQVGSHSEVYETLANGTKVYRPCVIYERRRRCIQRCGCGASFTCNVSHVYQVIHQWAY